VFAGTVRQEDWNQLRRAVDALERILQRARVTPTDELDADEREFVGDLSAELFNAVLTSSLIGMEGLRRRRVRGRLRRAWRWHTRYDYETAEREVLAYAGRRGRRSGS
jgi:hypothetical protein